MATEFGTGKTIFILAIVVGCFAVLWPKIFYPMLQSSVPVKPSIVPTTDCCDVIYDKDLNAIKLMTQLCEKILISHPEFDKRLLLSLQQGKITKDIVNKCNAEVHDKCNVDIKEFLSEKVRLGKTYQQMLSELRSLNSSFCLKINYGISPALLGSPRRFRVWDTKTLRQERPPHLRPHMMHPALREKGRAIPHSHIVPRVMDKEPAATPLPMPGMRPPMGGAGHVVPPPKGSGTMGIVMPLYTVGIVIFFMYTMMKLIFKKSDENNAYKQFQPDPEFRRVVFSDTEYSRPAHFKETHNDENNTKLVVTAISGLVAEVNRDIRSKEEPVVEEKAEEEPAPKDKVVKEVKEEESIKEKEKAEEVTVEKDKVEKEVKEEESVKQKVEEVEVVNKSELLEVEVKENKEELGAQQKPNIEELEVEEYPKIEELEVQEQVKIELEVPEKSTEKDVDFVEKSAEVEKSEVKSGGTIHVVGMEMTESLEGGQKWSRPPTPLTPRSVTPTIPAPLPEPQNIYLEGSLPSQSQLLVSQSEIEKLSYEGEESPVILSGKVTLSLIGLDDTLNADSGGLMVSSVSSNEASEEEEEEEEDEVEIVEEVSEDEAEALDNVEVNNDEDLTTNYTTASAAGVLGDETAAEVSAMEPQHDDEEEEEEEELEEDIVPQPKSTSITTAVPVKASEDTEEEDEEEESEEEVEEMKKEIPPQPNLTSSASTTAPLKETVAKEEDEEDEEEESEEEVEEMKKEIPPQPKLTSSASTTAPLKETVAKEEDEEDEEEEEEEEEDLDEVGKPQSLQHQR